MSVRRTRDDEDDENQQSSPGLGFAAAAIGIGVGVGAAMYYLFKKANDDVETSRSQAFDSKVSLSGGSFVTFMEETTTDTSVYDSEMTDEETYFDRPITSSRSSLSSSSMLSFLERNRDDIDYRSSDSDDVIITGDEGSDSVIISSPSTISSFHLSYSDRSTPQRDVTGNFDDFDASSAISDSDVSNNDLEEAMRISREDYAARAFRERTWTLEECSICFEVILDNKPVSELPCTHRFHADCINPWLRDRHTCPICRKSA